MKKDRLGRTACVAATVAAAIVASALPAEASRSAPSREARAIVNAVQSASLGGLDDIPRNRYRVTGVRLSSVSRSWAIARTVARPGFQDSFQDGYVVLVRTAARRWVVVDVGTAEVGCGIAPNAVLADLLGAGGMPCPPGEGYG